MTPTTTHSRAAAHYTGLLDHLHGEQIMEALRELERAQVDANKASVADWKYQEYRDRMMMRALSEGEEG